jgi:serine/threonine protein kinase
MELAHEATVLAKISPSCRYIIDVLRHGMLNDARSIYHIDMEICQINLHDYIHNRPSLGCESFLHKDVFVSQGSSPFVHVSNVWTIMNHISQAIAFVHKNKYLHRDLKPANGIAH